MVICTTMIILLILLMRYIKIYPLLAEVDERNLNLVTRMN